MKRKPAIPKSRAATAEALDTMHDGGTDMSAHLDLPRTRRPGRTVQRVNVDFPVDVLQEIDRQAHRLGVTRQAFIKDQDRKPLP